MEIKTEEKTLIDLGFVDRMTEGVDLPLTNREKEILVHLAQGKTNKEISKELLLSTSTVRNHISNIFIKLNISNRSQATAIAIFAGLLNSNSFLKEKPEMTYTNPAS